MKLLFVADGRSPIALNWISYFAGAGHEVHLISTFACAPDISLSSLNILPVAFSEARGGVGQGKYRAASGNMLRNILRVQVRTAVRHWLGSLTISASSRKLRQHILNIEPDLVHAMRIPFEGMVTAQALAGLNKYPLIVSVWGNDFTLHAPASPRMRHYTRRTLYRADALHADCHRDVRLAYQWGFDPNKKAFVLPGGGGIQLDVFFPPKDLPNEIEQHESFLVINPRGIRAYIRNDTFFRSIPLVRQQSPQIRFVCPDMDGEPQARRWVDDLDLSEGVDLLPHQTRSQMAELFRKAQLVVSPSEHDGTPNTLLEAMACGCFPVAGDIESIREWITPGVNGLLFNPDRPEELAASVLEACRQPAFRESAREYNTRLVAERAEHQQVMRQAEEIYRQLRQAGLSGF